MTIAIRSGKAQEGAGPAGSSVAREEHPCVCQRIVWIILSIDPERWTWELRCLVNKSAVDLGGIGTAVAHPTSNKVDHAGDLLRVFACIDHRQHTAARYA